MTSSQSNDYDDICLPTQPPAYKNSATSYYMDLKVDGGIHSEPYEHIRNEIDIPMGPIGSSKGTDKNIGMFVCLFVFSF